MRFPLQDFTNQFISNSYQVVVQTYTQGTASYFLDGVGNALLFVPTSSVGQQIITTDQAAPLSVSASYAQQASSAILSDTASLSLMAMFADTSSYSFESTFSDTASLALYSDYAGSSSYAVTASQAVSSSYAENTTTASFSSESISASYSQNSQFSISSSYAFTSSYEIQHQISESWASASWQSQFATQSLYSTSSLTASYIAASNINGTVANSLSSSYTVSSSWSTVQLPDITDIPSPIGNPVDNGRGLQLVYGSGRYIAYGGDNYKYSVYAYIIVNGIRVYSNTPIYYSGSDISNYPQTYYISASWKPVVGALGYRVSVTEDDQYIYSGGNTYFDTTHPGFIIGAINGAGYESLSQQYYVSQSVISFEPLASAFVGIYTNNPQHTLDVNGDANIADSLSIGGYVTASGTLTTGGSLIFSNISTSMVPTSFGGLITTLGDAGAYNIAGQFPCETWYDATVNQPIVSIGVDFPNAGGLPGWAGQLGIIGSPNINVSNDIGGFHFINMRNNSVDNRSLVLRVKDPGNSGSNDSGATTLFENRYNPNAPDADTTFANWIGCNELGNIFIGDGGQVSDARGLYYNSKVTIIGSPKGNYPVFQIIPGGYNSTTASQVINAQGILSSSTITANLHGTADSSSYANIAGTASFSSYSLTSSYVTASNVYGVITNALTASLITASGVIGAVLTSQTAYVANAINFVPNASTFSTQSLFATQSISASYAKSASYAPGSSTSGQSNFATQSLYATQSSFATSSISSSFSTTASWSVTASFALNISPANSASFASTSSYSMLAGAINFVPNSSATSTQSLFATQSTNATSSLTASYVSSSATFDKAVYANTSSWALTASFVTGSNIIGAVGTAITAYTANAINFVPNASTFSTQSLFATQSLYATSSLTASYVVTALTSSYVTASNVHGVITNALTASSFMGTTLNSPSVFTFNSPSEDAGDVSNPALNLMDSARGISVLQILTTTNNGNYYPLFACYGGGTSPGQSNPTIYQQYSFFNRETSNRDSYYSIGRSSDPNTTQMVMSGDNVPNVVFELNCYGGGVVKLSASGSSYITAAGAKLGIGTSTPKNALDIVGNISCSVITASLFNGTAISASFMPGMSATIVTKTLNYAITSSDFTVLMNGASALSATLPPVGAVRLGQIYHVKNLSTFPLTITTATGSQLIDGQSSWIIASQYSAIEVQTDGATWWII